VEETKRYYSIESVKLLRQYPVIEYMKLVEQRLAEEKKRLYLEETTLDRLSRACEEVLIEKHLVIFKNEFKELLSEEKRDDLGRMFRLVKKLPDGLKELCSWIESWIGAVKSSTIKRAGYAGHNVPEVLTLLATALSDVEEKSNALDNTPFQKDDQIKAASKLLSLVESIGVSKTLNEQFKKHLADTGEPLGMDVSVQVRFSSSCYGLEHRLYTNIHFDINCLIGAEGKYLADKAINQALYFV